MNTIFSINYLGSVQYWAHMLTAQQVILESNCFFERQTYRNRCHILGSNGVLPLSVPIVKPIKNVTKTKDALISYDTAWQQNHWRSIVSAYKSSPFFEYYADEYEKEYRKKHKFLWDFDMALMTIVCGQLEVPCHWQTTEQYHTPVGDDQDLREVLHPKKAWQEDPGFHPLPYHQVFGDKMGFSPNLSIIDLIFNKGPESALHLKGCMR